MPRRQTLLDRTYRLLDKCDLSQSEIARRSGLGYDWVQSMCIRRIADPSVNKVQRLHDFLEDRAELLALKSKGNTSGSSSDDSARGASAA